MTGDPVLTDRATACLTGLAIGDALGMPTQSMSRGMILRDHGRITDFVDAGPHQRIAAGMTAGSVTDDTEQALLLARLIVDGHGVVDPLEFADRLVEWERGMQARGSLDLLGPSTKAAVQKILDGVPASEAGKTGTTNGAAMRIAPVGIATPVHDLEALVDAVEEASAVTHNTGLGIAGASAVAAAISAGLDGAGVEEALDAATDAAAIGATRGSWVVGGNVAARIAWARAFLAGIPADERLGAVYDVIGTSVASQESVVAALALVSIEQEPWVTLGDAASVGGDTDTIGAMAGAVLGAIHGSSVWPGAAVDTVTRVNALDLAPLVDGLLVIRGRRAGRGLS
ncbi:ADP-ribosylglycohydrolase family protein [Frondihabitans australicus]|uniref:ADP-ribosylglycohydrolase n=1 Tax=Frondihabitans australicus TaxID=386892 RepID=A0A495ICW5_9MICO|nr:ADP-ribosylglycohydrolase family protein [Frondihabitans australicus]RKR72945.1 ADP-ribosylglycohydrolase [Frondihabitans australicus]